MSSTSNTQLGVTLEVRENGVGKGDGKGDGKDKGKGEDKGKADGEDKGKGSTGNTCWWMEQFASPRGLHLLGLPAHQQ